MLERHDAFPHAFAASGIAVSVIAEEPRTSRGIVAVYADTTNTHSGACRHERVTHAEIAKKLAALKGFEFADDYDPSCRRSGPVYLVPSQTLIGLDVAHALGIYSEHDLFGGVVPHAFVATKALTHPLVEGDAQAPVGWCHGFETRVDGAVLRGFSAFTREDAHRAGRRLLAHGPARIKPVRVSGGIGQVVVSDIAALETALDAMEPAELRDHGLVLEENLTDVTTYSVGQVRVAELTATYYGTQRLTSDNSGAAVYGGSDLVVVRGDFDALLGLDLAEEARLAVAQARAYDAAAAACFPKMLLSRRNYDVGQGLDCGRRWRSGVLEQSWRIGGASGAEIAALEAFRADPALDCVRASSAEVYGEGAAPPPTAATVYFRGLDEQVGFITKYALLGRHGHA
jgi:hypothetical protein